MLGLYVLSLAISSCLVAAFVRQALAAFGFAADFQQGVYAAGGLACAFAAVQMSYIAFLQFIQPTRSRGPYATEILSQLSALVLLPYLMKVSVDWPVEAMAKVEPFIYVSVFVVAHLGFKLATFFATLQGEPGGRLRLTGWIAAIAISGWGGYAGLSTWREDMQVRGQPTPLREASHYRIGDTYAEAAPLVESVEVAFETSPIDGYGLTLRWANPPRTEEPLDEIYVAVSMEGDETKPYSRRVTLDPDNWVEMRVPKTYVPANLTRAVVTWTRDEVPKWQQLLGIRIPTVARPPGPAEEYVAPPEVLLAGPLEHGTRPEAEGLNIILITIDGLSPSHMGLADSENKTTPELDRLAGRSVVFVNAFTPAPDVQLNFASLMSGLHPLQLDGGIAGLHDAATLAKALGNANYASAAFTEGEESSARDLTFQSGAGTAFEWFDSSYAPGLGSASTLEKARDWIALRQDLKFFLTIRLRELAQLEWNPRYAEGDSSKPRQRPRDIYEAALRYIDGELGEFFRYIQERETRRTTCIIVTAPYAMEFDGVSGRRKELGLRETALRVPLIVSVPGKRASTRTDLVRLEDLPAVVAALTGVTLDGPTRGMSFLQAPSSGESIAVWANTGMVSLRTDRWRYTTIRDGAGRGSARSPLGLFDVRGAGNWWQRDVSTRNPGTVQSLNEILSATLGEWTGSSQ